MNKSAEVRAYVAAHPGCTSTEVAAALPHLGRNPVAVMLRKMAERGLLAVESIARIGRNGAQGRYTLLREAKLPPSPEEAAKRLKARKRAADLRRAQARKELRAAMRRISEPCRVAVRVEAKPVAPVIVAETFEEWLAKGGVPEVLPSRWADPVCRRQPAMPNRVQVAA